jgi:hypothetical protein
MPFDGISCRNAGDQAITRPDRRLSGGLSGPEIRQIGRCGQKLVYMSADNIQSIERNTQSVCACAEAGDGQESCSLPV